MEIFSGKIINRGNCITGVITYADSAPAINDKAVAYREQSLDLGWDDYCRVRDSIINELKEKEARNPNTEEKAIIRAHAMMINDCDLNDKLYQEINNGVSLIKAIFQTYFEFYNLLLSSATKIGACVAKDLISLRDEMICRLKNGTSNKNKLPRILACDEIGIYDALFAKERNIAAVVERKHHALSHAAALLHGKSIPCIDGVDIQEFWNGELAVLDGSTGELFINPTQSILEKYHKRNVRDNCAEGDIKTNRLDNLGFELLATVNSEQEVIDAKNNGFCGIGLVRTEFLVAQNPSVSYKTQLDQYKRIASIFSGKKVCVRTFDFGGDKYSLMPRRWKDNGITASHKGVGGALLMADDFKKQIRAILVAGRISELSVLFPYITTLNEARSVISIAKTVQNELNGEQGTHVDVRIGFMIETVSAALLISELVKLADFINIGFNDLTKSYFSVADSDKPVYDENSLIPLKKLIGNIVAETHKANKKVCLCGENTIEILGIDFLRSIKIDAVSVSPQYVYHIKDE